MGTNDTTTTPDQPPKPTPSAYRLAMLLAVIIGVQSLADNWSMIAMALKIGAEYSTSWMGLLLACVRTAALVAGVVWLIMRRTEGWLLVALAVWTLLFDQLAHLIGYACDIFGSICCIGDDTFPPVVILTLLIILSSIIPIVLQGLLLWMLYDKQTCHLLTVDRTLRIATIAMAVALWLAAWGINSLTMGE